MRWLLALTAVVIWSVAAAIAQTTPEGGQPAEKSPIPIGTAIFAVVLCGAAIYAICFPARRE